MINFQEYQTYYAVSETINALLPALASVLEFVRMAINRLAIIKVAIAFC